MNTIVTRMSPRSRNASALRGNNLSNDTIRAFSPAVFTEANREDMGGRYQPVSTHEVVDVLRANGFQPMEVVNYHRADPARVPFAMHMIRFGMTDGKKLKQVGDVIPQVILRNSHDGSSPFEMYGGLFRLVCKNGLVVSDSGVVQPLRVRHTGRAVFEALFNLDRIVEQHKLVADHVDAMRAVKLTAEQQGIFASKALELRADSRGIVTPAALLQERRTADKGDDLWKVFNRVQENLTQGGLEGKNALGRPTKTRGVQAIGSQLRINGALWGLAMDTMAKAETVH